ncbi:MAG: type II/IV secretion system ATPase subunit [Candidatus Methanomethyliaceae archaeon]|nr:type II/IV secretion system ATPase subunit [Candidatus Methanomethyliaceae archaeon]MDW7971291.1 type II/IV secretion system ATPase subunit [Nitrososphaerota archaeon]
MDLGIKAGFGKIGQISSIAKEQESKKCSLTPILGDVFEDFALKAPHLHEYVHSGMANVDGIPLQFKVALSRDLRTLKKFNIIYPLQDSIFIHVHKGIREPYGLYRPIEPRLPPDKLNLVNKVEELFASIVDENMLPLIKDRKNFLEELFRSIVRKQGEPIEVSKNLKIKSPVLTLPEEDYIRLHYEIITEKVGFGLIEPLIRDPYIEDISCDGVGPIFIEHKIFGPMRTSIEFSTQEELDSFVVKICERAGRPVSPKRPIVDASLSDGSRLNVVFGNDISRRGTNFTIRKFSKTPISITQLIKFGTLDSRMAAYLWIMLEFGMSMFICGETASGKTTTLNATVVFIRPTAKIVTIEDTPEVYVPHPNWVSEVTRRGESESSSIELFDLLKAALRQRPNYIIVGEIRGKEGNVAFQAMQTGHPVISTFHAANMQKLIQRITGDPINIPAAYVDNLNVVVFQSSVKSPKTGKFERRVTSICEIIGIDPVEKTYNFIEVFSWDPVTDKHSFRGVGSSYLLEYKIAPMKGLSSRDSKKIYNELEIRSYILNKLVEMDITDYYEVYSAISKVYDNPYIADMEFNFATTNIIDKLLRGEIK